MPSLRFLAASLLLGATSVAAGELLPPGAPGPSMRTLRELRPATALTISTVGPTVITQSGSYYLTGNVDTALNDIVVGGIRIEADDVSLDLNGFSVGKFGAAPTQNGIEVVGTNIAIRNGAVHSNDGDGISCASNDVNLELTDVSLSGNGGSGVTCSGQLKMRGGHVNDNGQAGVVCGSCTIVGVRIASNAVAAVAPGEASVISRSIVQNHQGMFSIHCPFAGNVIISNSVVALNAAAVGGLCNRQESYVVP